MNTNPFVSNFGGTPGISQPKSCQKVWFPWVSKNIPNFLVPTPSTRRYDPDQKVWVWISSLMVPCDVNRAPNRNCSEHSSEPPIWGQQKGVTLICSDLFRFPRFLPICFRFALLVFRSTPICSALLRFVPICFQNKSEHIRETPGCRPLLQIPEFCWDECFWGGGWILSGGFACSGRHLDGPNRQAPIASVQRTRSTLTSYPAGRLGTNTTPTNANRAIRIAAQRTQGLRGPNSVFLGGDMTANER